MLTEKREYVLWDSYTDEDITTLDTRSEANSAQRMYEFNGEYQTRIRTVVTPIDGYPEWEKKGSM